MKEKILRLNELQSIDLRIKTLEIEMNKGPAEIQERTAALAQRQASVNEYAEQKEATEKRRRELDAEIADELLRIKDRQAKVMGIQTNREYQSLLKEIEDGKKTNRNRENEALQLMEEAERLTKVMEEQTNLYTAEEQLLAEDAAQMETQLAEFSAQKDAILEQRKIKAEEVASELMSKYEILRSRRNGMAVVPVTKGVCQGCFMSVRPQLFNEIIKGSTLVTCPNCQRILFHQLENEDA